MFLTRLFPGRTNEMPSRIHPRPRPRWRHHLARIASRGYSRALTVEALEDRTLLTAYVVDTPLDDPSAGSDVKDGLVSLREAVTAANNNAPFGDAPAGEGSGIMDEITFDGSLIAQPVVLGGVQLSVTDHLSLTGLGADKLTISGNLSSRVFSVAASVTAEISGITIVDGKGVTVVDGKADHGGGIYNRGTLTVRNCSLRSNSAPDSRYGGGIYNKGTLNIEQSSFTENSAWGGGCIASEGEATVTITGSTFVRNSARGRGGAIYEWGWQTQTAIAGSTFSQNSAGIGGGAILTTGTVTIAGSAFSNNTASRWGGALSTYWAQSVEIKDSTLSGNLAGSDDDPGDGGAIDNYGTMLKITNSTISENSTKGIGGAIYNYAGNLEITNSTLTKNRADADGDGSGDGGALYDDGWATYVLHNNIVAGNLVGASGNDSPDDFYATLSPDNCSYNLIGDAATAGGLVHGDNGNIVGDGGTGTIDITTVLDPNLANNGGPTWTHALVPGGLAVNAGDNEKALGEYDQRGEGFARIYAGTVDIGAFEVQSWFVQIDVKPASDPNSLNLASNGLIAVAIFTTADFDASQVNASTVVFAGASAVRWAMEDVDGDGDLDMVLHFQVQDTNLADLYGQLLADDFDGDGVLDSNRQTTSVSLTGLSATDEYFQGFDDVDLFLSGKHLRELLEDLAEAGAI